MNLERSGCKDNNAAYVKKMMPKSFCDSLSRRASPLHN